MKLLQFDGGVATRLAPQLLNNNQGVIYENIDNSTGVLTPLKDKLDTGITVKPYHEWYIGGDEWVDANRPTDFLEFQRVMYSTDRTNTPQKYKDGESNNLGIEGAPHKPTLVNTSMAEPLDSIRVVYKPSTTGGDMPFASFDYMLINSKDHVYANPFKFTVATRSPSRTTDPSTKAEGEVVPFSETTKFGANPIITDGGVNDMYVLFKDLLGPLADKADLFRFHEGEWRKVFTFVTKLDVFSDNVFDVNNKPRLDETLFSPFSGTYQYVYTYYNKDDGTESVPSPLSAELEVLSGYIQVTMPHQSSDPQVTHKRLYRVGGTATLFVMVEELDALTTQYLDKLSYEDMDGRLLESENFYPAPKGLKYLSESYAMLFGAVGTALRFTPIANPNAWPPEYEIQFDADITGIGAVANGVLVFTKFKSYIVTGTGPITLAQQSLRGDQGCIAFESIREARAGTIIWASEDGLCSSSGDNVMSLTKYTMGKVSLDPVDSTVEDEVYYCHNADGSTLIFDYRFEPLLKWADFGVDALSVKDSDIYGYSGGTLHTLYKGPNNLNFSYKSPRYTEGSYTEAKTYKNVYIRSEGDIIIDIIIDEAIVASFTLDKDGTEQLQVPQQKQRGYSIRFNITGTGVVHELEYAASLRKV